MSAFSPITLLINGLTLSLALGFLLIVLWYDARKAVNQFWAIFLICVALWNIGTLLIQAGLLVEIGLFWIGLAVIMREVGFAGSSVSIYALIALLVGVHLKSFRFWSFGSLVVVVAYNILLIVISTKSATEFIETQTVSTLFYLLFDGSTLYLIGRYRRKLNSRAITVGTLIFLAGQSVSYINPELGIRAFASNISGIGTLIVSFAILQQQIVTPLLKRISQIETMHTVTLAITSQLSPDIVLKSITTEATKWLEADAAGIFLLRSDRLELTTVHNLPYQFLQTRIQIGKGVAGKVALTQTSIYLESYQRDWSGETDLPLAKETFGSTICVPLVYGTSVLGVLMVVCSIKGRILERESVYLLELLGAQTAVMLSHGRLFDEQHSLTHQLEEANNQLRTVLTSTENPVIAVNRQLHLIFANPSAEKLFGINSFEKYFVKDILPLTAFPKSVKQAIRDVRKNRVHIYEVTLGGKVYFCHLAALGDHSIEGWVAVLNDITKLKELDRFKSEIVRMTSHDLKNPLQAAIANVDLLREDLEVVNNSEIMLSVDTIDRQLDKMNRIISGILDLERVNSGQLMFELCRVSEIVRQVVDETRYIANERNVEIIVNEQNNLPEFMGDSNQFVRALVNLVENAIKFSSLGCRVWINIRCELPHLIFEIKDEGIGIPIELQQRIFDRFFRGRQKEVEHVSGSGLGLSLVKAVVENHKGRVWVQSNLGEGSCFSVEIPLSPL